VFFLVISVFSSDSVAFSKHKLAVVMETHCQKFEIPVFFHPQCKHRESKHKKSMTLSTGNNSLQLCRCTQDQSFQTCFEFHKRMIRQANCNHSTTKKDQLFYNIFITISRNNLHIPADKTCAGLVLV